MDRWIKTSPLKPVFELWIIIQFLLYVAITTATTVRWHCRWYCTGSYRRSEFFKDFHWEWSWPETCLILCVGGRCQRWAAGTLQGSSQSEQSSYRSGCAVRRNEGEISAARAEVSVHAGKSCWGLFSLKL